LNISLIWLSSLLCTLVKPSHKLAAPGKVTQSLSWNSGYAKVVRRAVMPWLWRRHRTWKTETFGLLGRRRMTHGVYPSLPLNSWVLGSRRYVARVCRWTKWHGTPLLRRNTCRRFSLETWDLYYMSDFSLIKTID
jgi:hypothetical protein